MARRRNEDVRVLGPYAEPDRGRWRIIVVQGGGRRDRFHYPTEKQANQVARGLRRKYGLDQQRTIDTALDKYEVWMRNDKGNKFHSAATTSARLRAFLKDVLDLPLVQLSDSRSEKLYESYRTTHTRTGRPPAADTHRNTLSEAKTFFAWAVKRRWISRNPMAGVEPTGKRRRGKPQLRIDEAKKWLAKATELAASGDVGAVAAMMTILLGVRASEVVNRVVRDIDDGGRVLWIPYAKTEAGQRTLEVPAVLVPFLAGLAAGRKADEKVFGEHWRDWPRECVQRICKLAGVPKVTAHGMRGAHATFAAERGVTGHVVAAALGHESPTTTYAAYAQASAVSAAQQRRVIELLDLSELGNDSSDFVPQPGSENGESRKPV